MGGRAGQGHAATARHGQAGAKPTEAGQGRGSLAGLGNAAPHAGPRGRAAEPRRGVAPRTATERARHCAKGVAPRPDTEAEPHAEYGEGERAGDVEGERSGDVEGDHVEPLRLATPGRGPRPSRTPRPRAMATNAEAGGAEPDRTRGRGARAGRTVPWPEKGREGRGERTEGLTAREGEGEGGSAAGGGDESERARGERERDFGGRG
jgi:hypothetical protein